MGDQWWRADAPAARPASGADDWWKADAASMDDQPAATAAPAREPTWSDAAAAFLSDSGTRGAALKQAFMDRMQADIGGAKGALHTVSGLGRLARKSLSIPTFGAVSEAGPEFDAFERATAPEGIGQHLGFAGEQVAEFFVPGAAGTKAGAVSKLVKYGKPMLEAAAVRAAQTGGDPTQTAVAGALGFVAPPVARSLPGLTGAALRLAANNPARAGAVAAVPELLRGNYKAAAVDALMASIGLKGASKIPAAFQLAKALKGGASLEEAVASLSGQARSAFPAEMTRAELEAATTALIKAGRPEESRAMVEAMRAGKIKLTGGPGPAIAEAPAAVAPEAPPAAVEPQAPPEPARMAPGGSTSGAMPLEPVYIPQDPLRPWRGAPAPHGPVRAQGPIPEPGNVKMATIHQPEGTHYTTQHPEGAAQSGKVSAKSAAMVENQLRAIHEAGGEGNPLLGPSPQKKAPQVPAAPRPDTGRRASTAHADKVAFAKAAVKDNPKIGGKVWMELDDAGKPVKVLTPAQAAAAGRKGIKTDWIKNLWGDPRDFN